MDFKPKINGCCIYEKSNWFNRSLSSWIFPFYLSSKHNISKSFLLDSLPRCPSQDDADHLFKRFNLYYQHSKFWKFHLVHKFFEQNQFLFALIETFQYELMVPFLLFFIHDCVIKSFQPLLIGWIIRYFSDSTYSSNVDCFWVTIGLCMSSLLLVICHHPSMLFALRLSMRVKIIWATLIYNKCLEIAVNSKYHRNISGILNLLTNQTRRFDEFFLLCSHLILVPIQTLLILIISYYYIGPTCLATFIIYVLFAYINSFLSQRFSKLRTKSIRFTEKRLKLLNEIFRNFQAIKIYSLEKSFLRRIFLLRRMEIIKINVPLVARSIMLSFSLISSRVIMYLTFLLSLFLFGSNQEQFSIETLLVSVTLFEKLRYSLIWTLPQAISGLIDITFACQKMDRFLKETTVVKKIREQSPKNKSKIIQVDGMNLHVSSQNRESIFTMRDICFKVEPGQILMIIGPIGSGKSMLLLSLLSEIPVQKSNGFHINGSIAYTSQEPYCFNSTIRENILFGREYDSKRYKKVLELTSLDYDIRHLLLGDLTMVGEGGSNLSGGQKSRINLARALYSDADIYLLEDPFSSLDSHLAKRIYEKCLRDYLKDKIVLLTTHHLQYAQKSDYSVLLLNHGGQSSEFFENSSQPPSNDRKKVDKSLNFDKFDNPVFNDRDVKNVDFNEEEFFTSKRHEPDIWNDNWKYLKRGSYCFGSIYLIILTSIGTHAMLYLCDHWLSQWQVIKTTMSIEYFVLIYSMTIFLGIIFAILRSCTLYKLCHTASEMFHNEIIENMLIHMTILNQIPVGNLLNYFSRDIGVLDETLPSTLFELNVATSQVLSTMIVIFFLNSYLAVITIVYMLSLLTFLQYYVRPFQMIRKFELQTRNSVFLHLTSTMNGISTIRAYKVQDIFQKRFHILINDHTATIFFQNASSRLFCFLVDLTSLIYIVFILVLLQIFPSNVDGRFISVCLASIFNLIGVTQWACKRIIDLDLCINSFRNLSIFCDIEQNDDDFQQIHSKSIHPCKFNSLIEITGLSVYYNSFRSCDLGLKHSYVLKDINVCIESGQKIGICGRSGAGKSTLINTFLRLTRYEGQILIGGRDLREIPIKKLRRQIINIIAQYPIIFEGSIRENLNLFGHRNSDQKLWEVLDKVNLRTLVESFEYNLDEHLNSTTMSIGQKQLLCLARIILQHQNNDMHHENLPLIILDEATAHVDFQTDQLIQMTIRKQFRDCTLIIIAHRLDTILDCDRILVFHNGHLVEDGKPERLLANKSGHFYELVNANNR